MHLQQQRPPVAWSRLLRQAEIDRAIESKQQTYSLREALLLAYEEELAMIDPTEAEWG